MRMSEGQIYQCTNRRCGCQIKVTTASVEAQSNPKCCCGAEMKKPYSKPIVRTIDSTSAMEALFDRKVNRN